jgi:hypothetical protein
MVAACGGHASLLDSNGDGSPEGDDGTGTPGEPGGSGVSDRSSASGSSSGSGVTGGSVPPSTDVSPEAPGSTSPGAVTGTTTVPAADAPPRTDSGTGTVVWTETGTGEAATGSVSVVAPSVRGVAGGFGPVGAATGGTFSEDAPEPVDCEVIHEWEDVTSCEENLECTNDFIYTFCSNEANDTWRCNCHSNYGYVTFELDSADSSAACDTVSELCTERVQPEYTERETCSIAYQSESIDYCDIQERCVQSAEVDEGITAVLERYNWTNCYSDGTGSLYCDCSTDTTYRNFQITGTSGSAACELVMDLCKDPTEVVFDEGDTTCRPEYQYPDDDMEDEPGMSGHCGLAQTCTTPAAVSDAVTALQNDWQSADCQQLADGTAFCSCHSLDMSLSFEMDTATVGSDTCTRALRACTSGEELVLSGPIDCQRSYQSAQDGQYCNAQLSCGQAGTIGDLSLVAYGGIDASCQILASGEPATCSCSSGTETASFELDVDATDAWDMCSLAAKRCPDLVEVQIGGSGDYYGEFGMGQVPLFL